MTNFIEMKLGINGHRFWRMKDSLRLYRDGGPAVEYSNGDRSWYSRSGLHRKGGPAVDSINGNSWMEDGHIISTVVL